MMHKTAMSVLLLVLGCVVCNGQSSFQEITPGTSTREDVRRVLGQPLRSAGEAIVEYTPPTGIAKIEVEYRTASNIVERIEVYFARPISAQALIQKFELPQAEARKFNAEQKLTEYFGGRSLLALTYASTDSSSGVSRIGYYSRELFARAFGKSPPAQQNSGTQAGASRSGSGAAGLGEVNVPDYMRGPGGSSSVTVVRAGRGSTSGGNSSSLGSSETKQRKNTIRPSPSSDESLSMTVTTRADGIEVLPATRPGETGNNDTNSAEKEISMSASELRRFVGIYQFVQPSGPGVKPPDVRLVAGNLRLTMGAATYTLAPIFGDNFVIGDQGKSDLFRFKAVGERGVKVYFTIVDDKIKNLFIVENQRQPKRFYIAVPKR